MHINQLIQKTRISTTFATFENSPEYPGTNPPLDEKISATETMIIA